MSDSTFEIACYIKHETDNALLIVDPVSAEEIWLPLSQIEEIHRDKDSYGTVVMSRWIAQKKGLL